MWPAELLYAARDIQSLIRAYKETEIIITVPNPKDLDIFMLNIRNVIFFVKSSFTRSHVFTSVYIFFNSFLIKRYLKLFKFSLNMFTF